jgi:glycosyltransferase involved in cell wall biosynthesis
MLTFSGSEIVGFVPAPTTGPSIQHYHFALTALKLGNSPLADNSTTSVMHFHGPWALESAIEGESRLRQAMKATVERAIYSRYPLIVCASDAFRSRLTSAYGIPIENTFVSGLGVDIERFIPGNKSEARRSLGIQVREPILIGTVRRLVPRMGLDVLIESLRETPHVHLLLGGAGPLRDELEQLASAIGVRNQVSFLGRIPEEQLLTFFQAIDLMVVPTRYLEGFGLVILEAMACGTPVLATNVDGISEALGPYRDSHMIEPHDSSAISSWLNSEANVQSLSSSQHDVRQYAESKSWLNVTMALESELSNRFF